MFELSVACKYLIPRRRQLSVSIISLISICVIALVVWLIVVFFSVTNGLEKNWVQKLISLTAPVRITPTDAYYQSYYYQADAYSESADYSTKTIQEKLHASQSDPYDPEIDQELPLYIPLPDLDSRGQLKDLVKLAFASTQKVNKVSGLTASDFELTASSIHLNLLRLMPLSNASNALATSTQSSLNYPAFLGNFEKNNLQFENALLNLTPQDFNHLLVMIGKIKSPTHFKDRLSIFFENIEVEHLSPSSNGWIIPLNLLPKTARWQGIAFLKDEKAMRVIVTSTIQSLQQLLSTFKEEGLQVALVDIFINDKEISVQDSNSKEKLNSSFKLVLASQIPINAVLDKSSLAFTKDTDHIIFNVDFTVQKNRLKGKVFFKGLNFLKVKTVNAETLPLWIKNKLENSQKVLYLPTDPFFGEGVILPKSFRDAGVLLGDRGTLNYLAPTASMIEEQSIPIFVAGFYDPGIIPIGGKFILANPHVTALIRNSHQQEDRSALTNGINVRFDDFSKALEVKKQLQNSFAEFGITPYWKIETYQEYEFTQEIIRELQSQKNLFMLIAIVIIIVACSNIISMLVILVNDKKMEIGVLRSMGATSKSIGLIFGIAGALIGILGSAIGIIASIITLKYLNHLIHFLSYLQGHEMFSASVYGQVLPSELSFEALSFVMITTVCLSLLAGLIPAMKACTLRPSEVLRSGGQ